MSTSALDDATLARLRAEAATHASPFIDPALFRDWQALAPRLPAGWIAHVLGVSKDLRCLETAEMWLLVQAAGADAAHLAALAEQRAEAYRAADRERAEEAAQLAQAEREAWQALRARLPVPVAVCHNWTARHLDGYEQGADHIVVLADLDVGRLHRAAHYPLCWTPSRAHELRHVYANVPEEDEKRLPDCKACLGHAARLAR